MARGWKVFMKRLETRATKGGSVHSATLAALQTHYARLGHELAEERKKFGISQKSLSRLTGIDQAEISRIERDQVDPRMGTYVKLLAGLGLELRVERLAKAASSAGRKGVKPSRRSAVL